MLEDLPGYAEKYSSVFDNYNIYTTLNYYPEEYATARERFQAAENHHKRFLRMNPSPTENVIKERERELSALEADIPKACFVDLAFDFDVGKELKTNVRRHQRPPASDVQILRSSDLTYATPMAPTRKENPEILL